MREGKGQAQGSTERQLLETTAAQRTRQWRNTARFAVEASERTERSVTRIRLNGEAVRRLVNSRDTRVSRTVLQGSYMATCGMRAGASFKALEESARWQHRARYREQQGEVTVGLEAQASPIRRAHELVATRTTAQDESTTAGVGGKASKGREPIAGIREAQRAQAGNDERAAEVMVKRR